ncbi:rod-determining factor RdfA [Halopiger djelfimassiliensis]|uniref:rod-determining factor RdfA n=1 Tax=Halopiger djelfimassiliensis TaxID=1293047 RepID=UPI000678256F|nr:rod-determining factor RdfA [Halopiger djelfimassiliensis]
MTDTTLDASGATCGCKVGRVADRYGLVGLDDELVSYWTDRTDERYSTRDLAEHVNQRVLESALDDAGLQYKDGEVENTYRLLTSDDVSSGTRVQTRKELERDGIDVEDVQGDFVSHQTVYNHLTNCLEASLESPSDEERLERSRDKLGALRNRTAAVTEDTVDQLQRSDVLDIGEFNVLVTVSVTCEDCKQQYTIRDLLDQGGCDCQSTTE